MADYQDIINQLPIDQIAQQVGASPEEVSNAVHQAVPALLLGMDANAKDPAGADSLLGALDQHKGNLADGIDVGSINTSDGKLIARNIFGSQEDAVVSQLGSTSENSGLIKKLMPILAPIVMAWLANKLLKVDQAQGQPQAQTQSSGGILGDLLGQVLGGGAATAPTQTQTATPQLNEPSATSSSETPQMRMPDVSGQSQPAQTPSDGGLGGGLLGQILGGLLGGGKR